jgi:hypothetical protein
MADLRAGTSENAIDLYTDFTKMTNAAEEIRQKGFHIVKKVKNL